MPLSALLAVCPAFIVSLAVVAVSGAAPLGGGTVDTGKEALAALLSHSQSLTSLALVVIGGSILVLLQRGNFRPLTRRGRFFYLIFFFGWFFLALSIWYGVSAQSVYSAYFVSHNASLKDFEKELNRALSGQTTFLELGMLQFGLWLFAYLIWWVFGSIDTDVGVSGAAVKPPRREKPSAGAFVVLFAAITLPLNAGVKCDCLHFPYKPPPCFDQCVSSALRASTAAELELLHIDPAVAKEIVAKQRGEGLLRSVSNLPPVEREQVVSAFRTADATVAQYLASSPEEKTRLALGNRKLIQAWRSTQGAGDKWAEKTTVCTMDFTLKGWSAGYKTARGEGTISCDNGQTAQVRIHSVGGGLTAGKSAVRDGRAKFTQVADIGELFGDYASADAAAGAGESSQAQALIKGEVSLSLTGKGTGVELGVSFGKFTISRR
jgi:hypothetical protein